MRTSYNALLILLALTLISGCENMGTKEASVESEKISQVEIVNMEQPSTNEGEKSTAE